ncbi:MAG TPA: hypothetical protein VFL36_16885 [Myxococcales bacterium]|nr:hypothetical protein [Myxococcales bacterium]
MAAGPALLASSAADAGTCGSTGSRSWDIVVADPAAAAVLDDTIDLTAVSNRAESWARTLFLPR